MKPAFNDKLLVKVRTSSGAPEFEYRWTRITRIINDVFIMPVYEVEILDGTRAGETVHVDKYLDHAKAGSFISHEFAGSINS
jgi:hypothetical protein